MVYELVSKVFFETGFCFFRYNFKAMRSGGMEIARFCGMYRPSSAPAQENSERAERLLLQTDAAVIHICHKPKESLLPLYGGCFTLADGILIEK